VGQAGPEVLPGGVQGRRTEAFPFSMCVKNGVQMSMFVVAAEGSFIGNRPARHVARFHLLVKRKNPVWDEVSVVYLKGFEPLAF
jgi:hypothetical protein